MVDSVLILYQLIDHFVLCINYRIQKSGYGLENIFVFLSSCVLFWRFQLPRTPSLDIPENVESKFEQRDERAEVAILSILCALGLYIIPMRVMKDWQLAEDARSEGDGLDGVSNFSLIFGLILLAIDVWLRGWYLRTYFEMKCPTMAMERNGICVFIGFFLNMWLWACTNDPPSETETDYKFLTYPIISLMCSIFCLVYGLPPLYHIYVRRGVPIDSLQWWQEACYESLDYESSHGVDREEEMKNDDKCTNEAGSLEIV